MPALLALLACSGIHSILDSYGRRGHTTTATGYQPYHVLRAAMSSFVPVPRAARVASRDPATRRTPLSSRSLVAVGGDALGRLASTDVQAQAQFLAGPLVPAEGRGESVPMGMEDDGLDDVEEWETSHSAPVLVDAVSEFNRACQGGAMPIQDRTETVIPSVQKPERKAGTQSMTDQGHRTSSSRTSVLVPSGTAIVHPSTPQLRRAMPREALNRVSVPPMPGNSPGASIDVDDLLAAAVETEFYFCLLYTSDAADE